MTTGTLPERFIELVQAGLNSRVAELLVALGMMALVLGYVAEPLQRIPSKLDAVIIQLNSLEKQLAHCSTNS